MLITGVRSDVVTVLITPPYLVRLVLCYGSCHWVERVCHKYNGPHGKL